MPLESAITRSILRYLKQFEPDVFAWKIHGGPMQKAGMPDICVIYNLLGLWYQSNMTGKWHVHRANTAATGFFEVKQPGKKPTKLQRAIAKKLEAAGAWVATVTSLDEVKEYF